MRFQLQLQKRGDSSLKVVKEKLIQESKRRKQKNSFEDSVLKANVYPEKKANVLNNIVCYFCKKKPGHIRRNCQEYQNYLKKKNKTKVVAENAVKDDGEICFCVTSDLSHL